MQDSNAKSLEMVPTSEPLESTSIEGGEKELPIEVQSEDDPRHHFKYDGFKTSHVTILLFVILNV